MELSPERLVSRSAEEPLRPAYLIAGPETLRVLEAADALRAQARASGVSEREVFEAGGRSFDWDAVAASMRAPSLFSARRLLEFRLPSGKPGREGAELITQFCAEPAQDVLLVCCDDWSRQHGGQWSQAISAVGHVAIAWTLKAHELPDWIDRRLKHKGLRADQEAIHVLAERVEGNLLAAAQEIDKLALLDDGSRLDAAQMESRVADAARFDVFGLLNAAMNGHGAQVARMLGGLRAEGVVVPALLGMVAMELQRAATLARVQARGGNLAAAFKAERIWDSKQAAYRRALARHPPARWERFVVMAGRVDRTAKGRGVGDAWQQLERLLLAVAETGALRLVA